MSQSCSIPANLGDARAGGQQARGHRVIAARVYPEIGQAAQPQHTDVRMLVTAHERRHALAVHRFGLESFRQHGAARGESPVVVGVGEEYAKNYAIIAVPGIAKPLPNIPSNYEKLLLKNDFVWAAKNRDRILEEWNKRYNDKAEKG